jgi:DNA sulfur modification protein DndE
MILPSRIRLSVKATHRLRYMKSGTGLTPNILARFAIMKAVEDSGGSIANASVEDSEGQELSRDVLFGDYAEVYDVVIRQFIHENKIELNTAEVISALIEIGVHKMGHVKNITDLNYHSTN